MEQNQYMKTVLHKLNCTRQKKKEIEKELRADIQTAIAAGESWEEIEVRMGEAKEVAQEFNENFPPEEGKRMKKQKRIVVFCGIICVLVVLASVLLWVLPRGEIVNEKGKEHDETFSQVQRIISLIEEEDYETLKNQYTSEILKNDIKKEQLNAVKQQISSNWGKRVSFGKLYVSNIQQMGEEYKAVQLNVSYEHVSVTYTISFDKDMKLVGLYMR